jgi:hypothetical protein
VYIETFGSTSLVCDMCDGCLKVCIHQKLAIHTLIDITKTSVDESKSGKVFMIVVVPLFRESLSSIIFTAGIQRALTKLAELVSHLGDVDA